MRLQNLMKNLTKEEKIIFYTEDANHYYRYVKNSDCFSQLNKKLESDGKLTEEEWDYLLNRLYLVTCKAIGEEDDITISEKLIYLISKLGYIISKKNSSLYNEAYKIMEYIGGIKKAQDINDDLLYGYDMVVDTHDEGYLDILIRQHEAAEIFRGNKSFFEREYVNSKDGKISDNEKIAINSFNRGYDSEKKLVLKYDA